VSDNPTVLQISTMVPPARFGGAESVVESFDRSLDAAGFSVHNAGLKPRRGAGPGTPIPNLYWPWDGRRRNPGLRLAWHAVDALTPTGRTALARLIDSVAPDVLIAHNVRGWGLAPWTVAQQRNIPLIQVIHDYGVLCNASTLWHDGAPCGTVCRLRARRALSRWPGGFLIGVSDAVLAEHRRHGFGTSDPAVVIHPVHAAAAVDASPRTPPVHRPTVIGYLGRLAPEKGLDVLLDAVEGADVDVIVAGEGDGDYVEALRARSGPRVQWRGRMDPALLFAEIDVLVVPSRWREPFGLVVVEAARAGVPVLIADQPGLIEAAHVAGARYRCVAADDPKALRAALAESVDTYIVGAPAPADADIVAVTRQVLAEQRRSRR
jgi:glycosyltransferase involved in cell wall biosynthesis